MKNSFSIPLVHVAVLLVYTVIIYFNIGDPAQYRSLAFMMMLAMGMALHIAIGIILMIVYHVSKRPDLIKQHALGLGLTLLVGGSACFIGVGVIG